MHQAAIHCDQSAVSRSLIETVPASLAVMERQTIFATLDHRSGYKRRAAGALGVSLKTLYNRLNEYSDRVEEFATPAGLLS